MPYNTTNFNNGVTNAEPDETLGSYIRMDPTQSYQFFTDFETVSVGTTGTDWLATYVGSTPTTVASNVSGGALLITNTAGVADSCFLQWMGKNAGTVAETFAFASGKRTWFKSRFKVSDATKSLIVMGLQITDTTPAAVSDGVFFIKPAAAATFNFVVEASSTATTTSAVATLADNTYCTVGFVYDGDSNIDIWFNDVKVGHSVTTNIPISTRTLAVSFGLQNGEAVAKNMTVDYIFCAQER